MKEFNKLLSEVLEIDEINDEQRFEDIEGWGSLSRLCILATVEDHYKISITDKDILNAGTVGNLKKLIKNK
ncbi:MAG TPA: acyl carrier protein [Methanosarcinales archaeon]|nr:acyl carrier protein [Methanosarcinales archaeon]